jgi:splicing factor, arginine/serine-rich 12
MSNSRNSNKDEWKIVGPHGNNDSSSVATDIDALMDNLKTQSMSGGAKRRKAKGKRKTKRKTKSKSKPRRRRRSKSRSKPKRRKSKSKAKKSKKTKSKPRRRRKSKSKSKKQRGGKRALNPVMAAAQKVMKKVKEMNPDIIGGRPLIMTTWQYMNKHDRDADAVLKAIKNDMPAFVKAYKVNAAKPRKSKATQSRTKRKSKSKSKGRKKKSKSKPKRKPAKKAKKSKSKSKRRRKR